MACNATDFWCCLPEEDNRNQGLGIFYVVEGLFFLTLYIPCIIVIMRSEMMLNSCYKIMLALGLLDTLQISILCITDGLQSIFGITYCNNLTWAGPWGILTTAIWKTYMMLCLLLGFDRVLSVARGHWDALFFAGSKAWCWIGAILTLGSAYFIACLATDSYFPYHPGLGLHMFAPASPMQLSATLFDLVTGPLLVVEYVCVWLIIKQQARGVTDRATIGDMERRVLIQSCIICLGAGTANYTYLPGLYFAPYLPAEFWVFVEIAWQWAHGFNCIIYLTLNKTIRDGVLQLVGLQVAAAGSGRRFLGLERRDATTAAATTGRGGSNNWARKRATPTD